MNKQYRELQKQCKKRGLKANGKMEELRQRIRDHDAQDKEVAVEPPTKTNGEAVPQFVFVGDDGKRESLETYVAGRDPQTDAPIFKVRVVEKTVEPSNPARIAWSLGGDVPPAERKTWEFVLNGPPVQVEDERAAAKLRANRHFREA